MSIEIGQEREFIEQDIRVVLENIGEGWDGDFDPDDPDDENLLRFSIYKKENNEWIDVDDASYCTQIRYDIDDNLAHEILRYIMRQVKDDVISGVSIKRTAEQLSWLNGQ